MNVTALTRGNSVFFLRASFSYSVELLPQTLSKRGIEEGLTGANVLLFMQGSSGTERSLTLG